jgi:transposase-like protein
MMVLMDTKVSVFWNDGGVIMERISNAVFTKEFREEAVRMVIDGKLSVSEVAGRLSMSKGTLAYWIKLS